MSSQQDRTRDEDDEDDIEYGIRRQRRQVAWEYRDSSSLSSNQILQSNRYLSFAERMHERTLQYIDTITTLSITIRLVDILIDSWTQMGHEGA